MVIRLAAIIIVLLAIGTGGCDDKRDSAQSSSTPSTPASPAAPAATAAPAAQTIPQDVTYTVIKTDTVPGIKRSLDIRINKMVSEDVLRVIALKLKAEDARKYDRTFMLYYLPDMTPGSGAWASTHFDPELNVQILGFTKEQAAKTVVPPPARQDVIGRWVDNAPGFSSQITIYREGGKLLMDRKFQDGSSMKVTLAEKQSPLGRRFEDVEGSDSGDHFVIASNGDLQIRNTGGLIATAKAVR